MGGQQAPLLARLTLDPVLIDHRRFFLGLYCVLLLGEDTGFQRRRAPQINAELHHALRANDAAWHQLLDATAGHAIKHDNAINQGRKRCEKRAATPVETNARERQALGVVRVGAAGASDGLLVAAIHAAGFAKVQRTKDPFAVRAGQGKGLQTRHVVELPAGVRGALSQAGIMRQTGNLTLETRALAWGDHDDIGDQGVEHSRIHTTPRNTPDFGCILGRGTGW
jgi:hypothetical protein